MSEHSAIEWTHHTFNPWWGCVRVSPACEHCYAETFSKRVGQDVWGALASRRFFGDQHWAEPLKWNAKAEKAGERRRVFCASMADVFEDRHDLDGDRIRLWALIEATPALDWLLLTKRAQHITRMIPEAWTVQPRANVWFGTTVENQKYADERIPILLRVPARVRFLSVEPLLGPLDLSAFLPVPTIGGVEMEIWPDWVIVGGESGHGARPMQPAWAQTLRDQCLAADVAFHFKQWGEFNMNGVRQGKHAAGRLLDGREWNQFPA